MAVIRMNESIHGNTREYSDVLTIVDTDGTVTGDEVVLPDNMLDLSIAIFPPATTTAKVQISVSPLDDVVQGLGNWVDWVPGNVSEATLYHVQGPITAFRVVGSTTAVTAENTIIEATGNELV